MTRPAIRAEHVSVSFRPYLDRKPTLRRALARGQAKRAEVRALTDVSFTVERGEAFGVIGRNGAGKSTLLKVMAGTLRPDEGKVVVTGRTSTLLALGVGFNAQLSGRRNIYLGGLAAGLNRKQVEEIFDDVVAYAELEDAIDRPVNTYSSGMFSRLAFSVGMHLNPDILLLDEIMAVGDLSFREKSIQSMEDLLARTGTIVYVSHSLKTVAEFCDRAMWLVNGEVRSIGRAEDVVDEYRRSGRAVADRKRRRRLEQVKEEAREWRITEED
jgi:teichoic acid transport system ATP-binding protein